MILFSQFRRLVNVYFLVISILQLSSSTYSPTNPFSTIVPLVFVLLITAAREAIDDYRRQVTDALVNGASVQILKRLHEKEAAAAVAWTKSQCKDVTCGDIIFLKANDVVPADVILLSTSALNGVAYVDSSSLDGEPSLKLRSACLSTNFLGNNLEKFSQMIIEKKGGIEVECENQTIDINYFKGTLRAQISNSDEE